MTYEEFISKYHDRWSGTVDDFKKLGIGNADENGVDWLLKYQDAEDEGDVDKMTKLFPLAPLTLRQHAKFQKHANGFFEQFIKPNYADPKKQNQAFTAFINNTGFSDSATADAAVTAKERSGNPVLPMSDSEVKIAAAKKAAKPITASDVKANAAMPAQQMTVGERMADDIRKSGRMTAADQTAQELAFGKQMYDKANPNAPSGSLAAREAALARMRPNVLQGSGLYEYKTKNGGTNLASMSPDAKAPYSNQTNREVAYQKHFGAGGNWVGDNPLTGEVKIGGEIFSSQGAYEHSLDTEGIRASEEEANDYANNAVADGLRMGKLREEQDALYEAARAEDRNADYRKAVEAQQRKSIAESLADPAFQARQFATSTKPEDVALRARVRSSSLNDNSLNDVSSTQYASPDFLHWTKGNAVNDLGVDPSAGHAPDTYNNVTLPSNGFGVRGHLPMRIPNMKLPPMPQGSAEDAADERLGLQAFRNAMGPAARPENQVAQSGGRPLGPMNLNRPSTKPIVPIRSYPKFR